MPLLTDMTNRVRRSGANPVLKEEGLSSWWPAGRRSATRTTVDDVGALSLTAFYRGVTIIASTIASLPLHIYEEKADGTKEKIKTPETAFLWWRPNVEMTRIAAWERVAADEVRGNGFLFVEKDRDDQPASIWHLPRRRVRTGRTPDGMKVYEVDGNVPMIDYKQGGEIVHIPNWGDGISGYDPVALAQQALALGLSAEEYAAQTFATGQVPPGIITTDQNLTQDQASTLLKVWRQQHAGIKRGQDVGFLGNGAKFQQLSMDHEKMQMESLRRFQVSEVARLLGIPPHLLADVEKSTSWGTGIEEQARSFVTYTLQAHILRLEQAIDDNLLVRELTGRYCKFDLRGLLRGSTLQRYQAYAVGWGRFLTANDIRLLEDLEAVEGGDVLMQPTNMAPLEAFEGMQLGQGGSER